MDAISDKVGNSSARGNRGGRGRLPASRGAGRASSRVTQNVRDYAGDRVGQGNGSKAQFNRKTLKILGLRDSKAATNPDGGLRNLLEFLERKASKDKRPVTIGKVFYPARATLGPLPAVQRIRRKLSDSW